ncbi:MAG: DUF2946 family protein [Alphaproteobacteria bacterium]
MPYLRSRFPSFYRFAAFLALWAILVPMGVGLVHTPAAAQSFIHICGAGEHTNNDQGKEPAHKLPSCPICQSLHLLGGGFVPPDTVVVAGRPLVTAVYISADYNFFVRLPVVPQARPRAPPVLA